MALTGNEIIFVQGIAQNGAPAATLEQTTTGAIAALAGEFSSDTNTNITTVGNGSLTATALVGGLINRTGPVAAYSDTIASAGAIYTQVGSVAGYSFYVTIKNGTAFAETIVTNTGITLPTSAIIPPNSAGTYLVSVVSATATTLYHVQTASLTTNTLEVITALTTAGAGTITAGGIAGGITTRGGAQSGTPFTDITDIASAIITAQPNAHIGLSWEYTYFNKTDATATITGGTGVTVSGITVIPANGAARYLITYTAAATITMVGIATMGFSVDATDPTKVISMKTSGEGTGHTAQIAAVNSADAVYTLPAATGTLAALNAVQTWTAVQTFTNSDIKLLGSSTGATTFTSANASATNYTTTIPAISGTMASTSGSNLFIADIKRSSAQKDTITTAFADITGLTAQTLIAAATYRFRCVLPGTADGTSGIKYAFNYTTATLTSIEATGIGYTASAVAVQHTTTTTTQTAIFDQAAVVIMTILEGTMVVNAGGTVALQVATHTGTTTASVYVGATMEFVQIA